MVKNRSFRVKIPSLLMLFHSYTHCLEDVGKGDQQTMHHSFGARRSRSQVGSERKAENNEIKHVLKFVDNFWVCIYFNPNCIGE